MGRDLSEIRRDIDAIDDQIHELLMNRTKLIEEVRAYKQDDTVKIRPEREAEIIYRLFDQHQGKFPKRELFRIWRELIVATLGMEGPFSAGVFMDEDGDSFWDLARDQYGSFTPMTPFPSTRRIIEAVQRQEVTVGIVPLPARHETDPWWRRMAFEGPDVPRVIARLPFVPGANARPSELEALVISPVAQEPTGRDRTYIVLETSTQLAPSQLKAGLAELGLNMVFTTVSHDESRPSIWQVLVEVDDFVAPNDERLKKITEGFDDVVEFAVSIGGYATPVSAEELG
ncbi:chorismate mutase [Magnetovibrio sp. PR-2]|uniref:chorismate mutase n=1 Tax=Magnetovibrio sp. PR-2 TaxID=3120356 RepID=UPI002FCE0E1F